MEQQQFNWFQIYSQVVNRPYYQSEQKLDEIYNAQQNIEKQFKFLLLQKQEIRFSKVERLTDGVELYESKNIRIVRFIQGCTDNLSLVPSKASAAVNPGASNNSVHQGDEAHMLDIAKHQPGARVIVNGTFHHYSYSLYSSAAKQYTKGDNALYANYRGYKFNAPSKFTAFPFQFGYLCQSQPGFPFQIQTKLENDKHLYAISGSPMLICNGMPVAISDTGAAPLQPDIVTPPGHLSHLFQSCPRTMIAETIHGDLLLITVDGGMNFAQQVSFLSHLGSIAADLQVKHAMNLDGGGSTSMYVVRDTNTVGSGVGRIINQPSDPSRLLGNVLILFDHQLWQQQQQQCTTTNVLASNSDCQQQVERAHTKHCQGWYNWKLKQEQCE